MTLETDLAAIGFAIRAQKDIRGEEFRTLEPISNGVWPEGLPMAVDRRVLAVMLVEADAGLEAVRREDLRAPEDLDPWIARQEVLRAVIAAGRPGDPDAASIRKAVDAIRKNAIQEVAEAKAANYRDGGRARHYAEGRADMTCTIISLIDMMTEAPTP